MRVLLLKDVRGLGHAGDIKEVAGGYAANYLFPNKLAQQVSEGAVKQAQDVKQAAQKRIERRVDEAKILATKLEGQTVVFKAKTGDGDRLYGSITAADVADALSRSTGLPVDRRHVELEHPIKTLGQHQVLLKLGRGNNATITAVVERGKEGE
jgi:large subunit ribosomal protein L9